MKRNPLIYVAAGAVLASTFFWIAGRVPVSEFSKAAVAQEKPADSKIAWESLGGDLWRTKVPGGWLVKFQHYPRSYRGSSPIDQFGGITFYPDPQHAWDGKSLK